MRFFIDSSVLFAMAISPTGAARELLRYALTQEVQLILSDDVIKETRIRLFEKRPQMGILFNQIAQLNLWEIVNANNEEKQAALSHVADPEDAHILAAAKLAQIDGLISFDRKHLHKESVEAYINAPVMIAGDALHLIRSRQ